MATNGSVATTGLPGFIRVLAVAGVTGVIAMYLVWFLAASVSADIGKHADESRTQMEAIKANLWVMCRALAPVADRTECRR